MKFDLFVCADFDNCGRPFMAIGRADKPTDPIACPYCREVAERVGVNVDTVTDRELADVARAVEDELARRTASKSS